MNITEESLTPRFVGTEEKTPKPTFPLVELLVFMAAVLGHMPTLGAWWNQDDWGLLGRSAGLLESAGGFPARIVSQNLYWDLTWPIFGIHADPHSWLRLALHGLCAIMVTRIASRAGLNRLPRLIAGLLVAATPLVFTPLYWAAGIQELLGAVFALAAIERFLGASRKNLFLATLWALLSILSKEAGLGLPVLFMAMLLMRIGPRSKDRALAWGLCLVLLLVAIFESVLVYQHFSTSSGNPYALGGITAITNNLGTMGWWMLSPGPLLADTLLWPQVAAGAMLFVLWAFWGFAKYHQGQHLPLLTLIAGLGSILPALPLEHQMHPYLGYLAICAGSLALSSLMPRHWKSSSLIFGGLTLLAAAWGFFSMETRLNQRDEAGLPADPVVRATSLSWQISRMLPQLPLARTEGNKLAVTFLQIPTTGNQMEMADRLGERWVSGTRMHESMGGVLGPQLILGKDVQIDWTNALFSNPGDALVLCEMGPSFRHWGNTANASLYAALADIGMGRFERGRKHLIRGANLNDETMVFAFDPGQMAVSIDLVLARKEEFIDWTISIMGSEHSPREIGGLQDVFFNLLSAATGQSIEELEAGSTQIIKESTLPEKSPAEVKGIE